MNTLVVHADEHGLGFSCAAYNPQYRKSDIVVGKISENLYQVLKDSTGTLKVKAFYTKEEIFLEMI